MTKQWKHVLALMVVVSLCATGLAKPPKRPNQVTAKSDANKPRVVASASLASINAAKAFMAELGQPLDDQTIAGLTSMIPIGAQVKLAFDKPIAVLLVVAKDVPEDKMAVIAIPVAKDQGLIKQLLESGAQKVKGHDDTVILQDMLIRRTENYLLINGTIDTITAVTEGDIMSPYAGKPKGTLVLLDMDANVLRKAYPEQVQQLVAQSLAQMQGQLDGKESKKMAQFWSDAISAKIQRVQFRIGHTEQHLSFTASVEGYEPWDVVQMPRPKLNGTVLTQIDLVYEKNASLSWLEYLMALGNEQNAGTEKEVDKETLKGIRSAFKLFLGGDGASFFVTQLEKRMVVGVVQQHSRKGAVEENIKEFMALAQKMAKKDDDGSTIKRSDYVAKGGQKVVRVTTKSGDGEKTFVIDFADAGKGRTLITFAFDDAAHVSDLLPLESKGKMATGLNAIVDLGSIAKASMQLADGFGQGEVIDEETAKMIKTLTNHPLKFGFAFKNGAYEFSCAVPMSLIKQAGEAAGVVGSDPAADTPLPTDN